jgi:hypothetical protein
MNNENIITATTETDIKTIMNQTNYTKQESYEKLVQHNFDKIKVIKEYLGIPLDPPKKVSSKSINQEIYKQIRKELDVSMNNYNRKNPLNIEQVIHNFKESEERLRSK